MIVVAAGRGAGKSFKLAAWVLAGQPVPVEPGRSRIAIVHSRTMRDWFIQNFGVPEHIVFTAEGFRSWQRGRLLDAKRHHIEIGVDEPGMVLSQLLGGGFPVGMLAGQAEQVWTTVGALRAGNGEGRDHIVGDDAETERVGRARLAMRDGHPRAEIAPGLFRTAEPGRVRYDRIEMHREEPHDEQA
jgi:hypothetical protein